MVRHLNLTLLAPLQHEYAISSITVYTREYRVLVILLQAPPSHKEQS